MRKRKLIATLGTSPAVITEAIDLLLTQDLRPNSVCLIKTQDREVNKSFDLLYQHISEHYRIELIESLEIENFGDIKTTESAVEFMQKTCHILKSYHEEYECYVCIAGGRKAMSALLVLAVQFYGAERLFHVWAPRDIEKEGEICNLENMHPDRIKEVLHPRLDGPEDDRPCLVDLPFIGLFSLLPRITAALQKPNSDDEVKEILLSNGLLKKDGHKTDLGKKVGEILESVQSLPPARIIECKIHISNHHYKRDLEQYAEKLKRDFLFITDIKNIEWSQGEDQIKTLSPNKLEIKVTLGKQARLGLHLTTTATTKGQLEP